VEVTSGAVSTRNAAKERKGEVGAGDAARPKHAGDLVEIAAHRIYDLRTRGEVFPGGQEQWPGHRTLPLIGWAAKTCASIASAALRYWEASQSSARCR
jgi:hypothetical protein